MPNYRELSKKEHEALEAFAHAHGRKWKDELTSTYWYNARLWHGPDTQMGSTLHAIRNDLGPAWLCNIYKLPARVS